MDLEGIQNFNNYNIYRYKGMFKLCSNIAFRNNGQIENPKAMHRNEKNRIHYLIFIK
jgi:hypothetical protein